MGRFEDDLGVMFRKILVVTLHFIVIIRIKLIVL